MRKEHHIIYVPGLNDQHPVNKNLSKLIPVFWRFYGIQTHIVAMHWEEDRNFAPKLQKIIEEIDVLAGQGHTISLIGQSAGGSAIMNAFAERRAVINGAVNVGGRLKEGENVRPTLKSASRKSPAFMESLLLFEKDNEPTLTEPDRRKILTIRPFWDEVVPTSTVAIRGARNFVAPFPEHSLGGVLICTLYAGKIFDFLNQL